jgi:glycosyltransferase involved in cell wall biosynthesis
MTLVNYISNHALGQALGGWDSLNASMHQVFSEHFQLNYVGPINPRSDYPAKLVSKLRRTCGLAGSFHFYSRQRLKAIARAVRQGVDEKAECDFFHGPTPWIMYDSPRPYFVYADTCFSTYMDLYHDRAKFLADDLKRICDVEARWLARATGIFLGSQWALDQVISDYSIPGRNMSVAGTGGGMAIPDHDEYAGGKNFLFIAYDFERKGGRICADAFRSVQARFPDARLTIVGGPPPAEVTGAPGVEYLGFLRKSVPAEMAILLKLYATAFALVHPTSSDIQPLVICEAGYSGCPAITARSFGIPELVSDGETGFLIKPPLSAKAFAARMLELCEGPEKYLRMRKAAREYTTSKLTWDVVGGRIATEINARLAQQTGESANLRAYR